MSTPPTSKHPIPVADLQYGLFRQEMRQQQGMPPKADPCTVADIPAAGVSMWYCIPSESNGLCWTDQDMPHPPWKNAIYQIRVLR